MSQMNKPGAKVGSTFKPGLGPTGKAKAEIAHQQGKVQRGMAQIKAGEKFMGAMNVESGKLGEAKAMKALANAANAPRTGPVTIGARTGKGSAPTQLGSAKMKVQTASLGPKQLGAAKIQTAKLGPQQLGAGKIQTAKIGPQELGAKKLGSSSASSPNTGKPGGWTMGKPGVNKGPGKK